MVSKCLLVLIGFLVSVIQSTIANAMGEQSEMTVVDATIESPMSTTSSRLGQIQLLVAESSEFQLQKSTLLAPGDTTNQDFVCGLANRSPVSSRIVGGTAVTSANEFPWQVYLIMAKNTGSFSACSGSLIDSKWVLTAAHCLYGGVINVTLHFGSQNIIGNKEPNQLVLNSDQMFIYPQWDMRSMRGDLALVRLPKVVPFTDNIRPVCLPKANDDSNYVGDPVTLTGWGSVSDAGGMVTTLRKADSTVISNSQCQQWYPTVEISDKYHVCILGNTSGTVCNGDSGGPMNFKNVNGIWTAIGVVSFGPSSCVRGIPSVFTRIQSHLDWIDSIRNGINRMADAITATLPQVMEVTTGTNTLSTTTEESALIGNANLITVPPISMLIIFVTFSVLVFE